MNLLRDRLDWHNENGFFETTACPIPDYISAVVSDDFYTEFIRKIGPIKVNYGNYLVMAVTLPSSYQMHEHWWQDTSLEKGEQLFSCSGQYIAKIKDIQLVVCDSSLFFGGFDVKKNLPKLVCEPDLGCKYGGNNFFLLVEELLRVHEEYCKIDVPTKFNSDIK